MMLGDQVKLSEKCLAALDEHEGKAKDAMTGYTVAVAILRRERDYMINVVREHHPELDGLDFLIKHGDQAVVVGLPIPY